MQCLKSRACITIMCLKGSPVSLAVVNRDTNLNLNYSEEITTETTTENPNDIMLRSGPHEPEEENKDTSKIIIIVEIGPPITHPVTAAIPATANNELLEDGKTN